MLLALITLSVVLMPAPSQVKGLVVEDTTYNSASLKWKASENADDYHVYRSENGKDYEYIGTVTETKYEDTDLRTGTKYRYKVKARNGIKKTSVKNAAIAMAVPKLDKPKIKVNTNSGKVELKIAEVEGATSYEIFRDNKKLAEQEDTVFVDEDASSDKKHVYKVRAERTLDPEVTTEDAEDQGEGTGTAIGEGEETSETTEPESAYSEFSKSKKVELTSVSDLNAEIIGDDIKLTWEPSEHYSTYRLYEGEDILAETDQTEYMIPSFDPDKKYKLRLAGVDGEKESPSEEQTFVITERNLTNEEALDEACKWAEMIAADDSFTYGEGSRAHRYGCYFCGTNTGPYMNKKGESLVDGHSYEKTYCCNPFVHAAFAHGAGDPAMLADCQRGKGVAMSEKSFTKYGNWTNAGKPALENLRRGDVLCCPSHVVLYVGDGMVAEATETQGPWSEGSIRVRNLSQSQYDNKWRFIMRYTGTGSGVKYEIEEHS